MMRHFRNATNVAIFLIQGALAVMFFFTLSSVVWEGCLLASLGVVLELAKRLVWIEVKSTPERRFTVAFFLAVFLSVISGMASVAFTYTSVQNGAASSQQRALERGSLERGLSGLDLEADTIRNKLRGLPDDWVTSSLKYSQRLGEISAEKALLNARLGRMGETGSSGGGSQSLKDFSSGIGLSYPFLLVGIMGLIALVLEMATYSMIHGRAQRGTRTRGTRESLVLETAFQGPDKPLLGRRKIAVRVGMEENAVRAILKKLEKAGLVEVPKGKRAYWLKFELAEALDRLSLSR